MRRLWIDTHVHVCDGGPHGQKRRHFLNDLLAVLDREAADLRFVISPDAARLSRIMEKPEGVLESNAFLRDLCQAAPRRLYGSCTVNPHFLDESLRVMDLCYGEWGFVQLGEMLQYMMGYVMDSEPVERLVRKALEYEVPVQVHISTSNRREHPSSFGLEQLEDLCHAVQRVPEAKYILAHAVGMPDDDPPVVNAYLDFVETQFGAWPRNFWLEIRDFNSPGVRSALARVPHDRLLAGTDWVTRVGPPFLPYGTIFGIQREQDNPYSPCVETMVCFLREAGASEATVDRIGSVNARELYGIE
ncbi:MAG: amidohydrolase family protein [Candidatus Zipacnadales bacterium]